MFRKVFTTIIVSILACSWVMSGASFSAFAAEAGNTVIEMSPTRHELDLAPGKSTVGVFKVKNHGQEEFTFKLLTTPFQVDDGYSPDYTTQTDYTKLQNWITFNKDEVTLQPGEEVNIKFKVDCPEDAPGGGQYAAIAAETRGKQDGTIKKTGRVVALVYAKVDGDVREGGELVDYTKGGFLFGQPIAVAATVRNTGNVDFRLKQTMTVQNFFSGRTVFSPVEISDEGDSEITVDTTGRFDGAVFPGTTRTGIVMWEYGSPKVGVFKVTQTIEFLDQNYTFDSVIVVCPWWLIIGATVFIVLLIIWLVLVIIKRKRQKSTIVM